ncbi:hypothetical protein [Acinetobacter ursingii]|uniref:hypothetical protein n=1 Tax=Acinetobacter ursingii TaxID=108980 RepID=UPI001250CC09|nr:hypothetical protein [Acinetobacter ursingii]
MNLVNTMIQLKKDIVNIPSDAQGYHINNCRFIKKIGENYFYYYDYNWFLLSGCVDKADILPLDIPAIMGLFEMCEIVPIGEAKERFIENEFKLIQNSHPL